MKCPCRRPPGNCWYQFQERRIVIPGRGGVEHLTEVKKSWAVICKAADIQGLRIHDLRHSFASQLKMPGGASLPLIGALLGHSQPATTARYAHLFDDPLRQAVERVGAVYHRPAARQRYAAEGGERR